MGRSIESRIEELEGSIPRGYTTFDSNGRPVIQSNLPLAEWVRWAFSVLSGRRGETRRRLLDDLSRSERSADGSLLHEYLLAIYEPVGESR